LRKTTDYQVAVNRIAFSSYVSLTCFRETVHKLVYDVETVVNLLSVYRCPQTWNDDVQCVNSDTVFTSPALIVRNDAEETSATSTKQLYCWLAARRRGCCCNMSPAVADVTTARTDR